MQCFFMLIWPAALTSVQVGSAQADAREEIQVARVQQQVAKRALDGMQVDAGDPGDDAYGWHIYVNTDAMNHQDFDVHEHEGTVVESSHPTTSKFPQGPPPMECYDICFEDPECHGFVLSNQRCWFRG